MKNKVSLNQRKAIVGWSFMVPAILCLLIFTIYPFFYGLWNSFQTKSGLSFNNYAKMMRDANLVDAIKNMWVHIVANVVIFCNSFLMACVLQQRDIKGKGIFRTVLFIPSSMALIASSLIFKLIFLDSGLVNGVGMALGIIDTPFKFFASKGWSRFIIGLTMVWRWSGYNMIMFSAGLANIDQTIYEAAELDGAVGWKALRYISIPLLKPIIVLVAISCINGCLNTMEEIMLVTSGGPANATISIGYHIYDTAFKGGAYFSYGSAMSIILMVVVVILSLIQMKVGDKRE